MTSDWWLEDKDIELYFFIAVYEQNLSIQPPNMRQLIIIFAPNVQILCHAYGENINHVKKAAKL